MLRHGHGQYSGIWLTVSWLISCASLFSVKLRSFIFDFCVTVFFFTRCPFNGYFPLFCVTCVALFLSWCCLGKMLGLGPDRVGCCIWHALQGAAGQPGPHCLPSLYPLEDLGPWAEKIALFLLPARTAVNSERLYHCYLTQLASTALWSSKQQRTLPFLGFSGECGKRYSKPMLSLLCC